MSRIPTILLLLLLKLGFGNSGLGNSGFGATATMGAETSIGSVAVEVATLKDQLEKGLRARLPKEFAFVQTVVTMVDNNQLSTELVLGTFHWARKKAKYKKYPFPYFEQALRARAAKIGVQVP